MSMPGFLEINGESQGNIEGSCTKSGFENTIEILAFEHSVVIPYNNKTGIYTGIRSHKPIQIQKEIDKSSPKLYQALCTGENLTEMIFSWHRAHKAGKPEKFYSIELKNATLVDISPWIQERHDMKNDHLPHMEKVSIVYEKIRWIWVPDGGEFEDTWLTET